MPGHGAEAGEGEDGQPGDGALLLPVASSVGEDRPRYPDTVFGKLEESRFPSLAAVGERWPELAARDTFAAGLRAFVDGMLAQESK